MRWLALLLFCTLGVLGCTVPNPESCADGKCTDDRYPFCDSDGTVAGTPNACIAVSCTPNEFEACRGDDAITCDAIGNNFTVTDCPLGCDAASGGCKQCTTDVQCPVTAPICGASGTCGVCHTDDECPSRVCNVGAGTCVPESEILYASPQGNGSCLKVSPCSMTSAVAAASAQASGLTIRMLPGQYVFPVSISGAGTVLQPLNIVGQGASLVASPAISISNGTNVVIRNLDTTGSIALQCATSGTRSKISWRDSKLIKTDNGDSALVLSNCDPTFDNVEIALSQGNIAISIDTNVKFRGDRMNLHGSNNHYIFAAGSGIDFQLTNSLLVEVGFAMNTTAGAPNVFRMAHVTSTGGFGGGASGCAAQTATPNLMVFWENSFIAPLTPTADVIDGALCTFRNVFVTRQAVIPPDVSVGDPKFISAPTGDYHLSPSSPGIDAAVPSNLNLTSTIDLDGNPRPLGAASDSGAYERMP
jgi:hypothetical protein